MVLIDGKNASVLGEYVEDNPEDPKIWAERLASTTRRRFAGQRPPREVRHQRDSILTGLARKSSIPAARHLSRSTSVADGRHRNYRRVPRGAFDAADLSGRGVAVHLRHLAVHEHRGVVGPRQRLQRLEAVGGDVGAEAEESEDADCDELIGGVVFDDEHMTRAIRCGRRSERHGRAMSRSRRANALAKLTDAGLVSPACRRLADVSRRRRVPIGVAGQHDQTRRSSERRVGIDRVDKNGRPARPGTGSSPREPRRMARPHAMCTAQPAKCADRVRL